VSVPTATYTFVHVQTTVELRVASESLRRPKLYCFEQSHLVGDFLDDLKVPPFSFSELFATSQICV